MREGKKGKGGRMKEEEALSFILTNDFSCMKSVFILCHSLFAWKVPFLCWLALAILSMATLILFFIPLRYVILIWGRWLCLIISTVYWQSGMCDYQDTLITIVFFPHYDRSQQTDKEVTDAQLHTPH